MIDKMAAERYDRLVAPGETISSLIIGSVKSPSTWKGKPPGNYLLSSLTKTASKAA